MASIPYRPSLSLDPECSRPTIPHVFVIPPEEEDSDPWLCFDPNDPLTDPNYEYEDTYSPESDELYSPWDMQACPPDPTHSGVAFPHFPPTSYPLGHPPPSVSTAPYTGDSTSAIVEALLSESLRDGEEEQGRRTFVQSREPGNDSEVVEVVKVKRTSEDSDKPSGTRKKRSSSILSRAFQSIRNVTRSSSKSPDQDTVAAAAEVPAPQAHSLVETSKRPKFLRKRTSSRPSSIRSSSRASDLKSPSQVSFASDVDERRERGERPPSPSPSTLTTRTTKSTFSSRRFSVLSLNRFFASSSQAELPQANEMGQSRESIGPSTDSSTSSSSPPSTPVSGAFALPSPASGKPVAQGNVHLVDDDNSVEMRLDSLHFDSLSFDASEFR